MTPGICTGDDKGVVVDHNWIARPAYLKGKEKFARSECSGCGLSKFVPLPPDDTSPFTMGHRVELWDGTTPCDVIQQRKREAEAAQQAAIAAQIQAAEEQERARIAAGGAPLPSQEERIRMAEQAASERARKATGK